MDILPCDEKDAESWDRFCAASPDAWFWHTTAWRRYTREYSGAAFVRDASFWIVEGSARLGIAPVMLETWDGAPSLGFSRGTLPAPAADPNLSPAKRREVLETAVGRLKTLAAENKIDRFQLRIPATAPSVLEAPLPMGNPLLRFDALDLPYQTQIIDLRRDMTALWADVRHGFQSDVKKARKTLTAKAWSGRELEDAKFKEYQELHAKDAGRVTRSQATFDMMRQWTRDGHAALIEVRDTEAPVAFALIMIFGKGAFYGSACKDPDKSKVPSMHLAQWAAVEHLKERGVLFYDLGQQDFGVQWFSSPSPKNVNISLFKRGLGGTSAPLFTAEFHLKSGGLRAAVEERLARNLPR